MQLSNGFKIERIGKVAVIRFDRPEIRNPLSVSVIAALSAAVAELSGPQGCVVFTGTNEVFASGADLKEIAIVDGPHAAHFAEHGQRLMRAIAESSATTIAAINGYCFGGALDLALACDRRIASPDAQFCHPGAGLGIMTGWGGTQRLPRLIGEAAALDMFLRGKVVSAEEALILGLVDAVTDDPVTTAIRAYL